MNKLFLLSAIALGVMPGAFAQSLTLEKSLPFQNEISISKRIGAPAGSNVIDPASIAKDWSRRNGMRRADDLPPTRTAYVRQFSNLFFGLADNGSYLGQSVMVGPVFQPVRYDNSTPTKDASFTWTYHDTSGMNNVSHDKNLTVTYRTNHTLPETSRNNLYYFPKLEGSSATTASDSFQYPGFFQAGGAAEYSENGDDGAAVNTINFGLSIVDPATEGMATYVEGNVPLFGYNEYTDEYWNDRTFDGLQDDINWSHMERYGNFFYSPDSPLVIEGVHTMALGKISKDAEFVAEIYFLNGGFVTPDFPNYTATCRYEDITVLPGTNGNDLLSLNFKFDEPVVINKRQAPYFLVAIGGFRDKDNVEYFNAQMSAVDNPNGLGLSWIGKKNMLDGNTFDGFSWSSTSYYVDDRLVSFYIMLDGAFPWLEGDATEVNVVTRKSTSITLDSYYEGRRLEFENVPSWLDVEAEGRYGDTVVTFTANESAVEEVTPVTVTIKAPGVSKNVTVSLTVDLSGVDGIADDAQNGEEIIYTIDGRRVRSIESPGIYIVNGRKVKK